MNGTRLIAGAMSGTSADGVDVAIVRIEGTGYNLSACLHLHHHRAYDPRVREAIFAIRSKGTLPLPQLTNLAQQISLVYAAAINEALVTARLNSSDLHAVACHGQTLYHNPPLTLQWLDPSLVAAEVGCQVVSDFRRADCAAGGQGAPLVPYADYILFRHPKKNRVMVNIGGIANLTYLPAGGELGSVVAFDTGPGNCISDWLMRTFDPASGGIDLAGQRAGRGKPVASAVRRMLAQSWFAQRPPKSTDGPAMIELFCGQFNAAMHEHSLEDLLATAARVTAESLTSALQKFLPGPADEVILSGGGTHNKAIMDLVRQELGAVPMLSSDDLGVRSEAKEAMAFALLAAATLDHVPSNVPNATGARRAVVLGSITPKP